ncbi:hypothetical protein A2996_03190 [Candidatus Campbellbacteria bacterium RIFCSPLOWO2_01_FULL_34_15]|uniref:Uncharacterized protein n=1 Tax=Candidatus Campbellbacteria bacterium RIFCSPLOWO2_01_FULL_34_15 TaxID=1797579 RepID=A0A1F5EPK2_9BACT|nr:MAG: hypothetical protein A2996_03190 [Candidatus Campbellbacteria bacterium RIFCSPLOWO2_01_FULL_34_15]
MDWIASSQAPRKDDEGSSSRACEAIQNDTTMKRRGFLPAVSLLFFQKRGRASDFVLAKTNFLRKFVDEVGLCPTDSII